MNFIQVTADGRGFCEAGTGARFVPIGANYASVIGKTADSRYSYLFGTDAHTAPTGVAEVQAAFARLGELGMTTVRLWLEPDEFFPHGYRVDSGAAARFEALLAAAQANGLRVSVGLHMCPIPSGWKVRGFEPPHLERHVAQWRALALRWGDRPEIFSWSIVGEGILPWETPSMRAQWPAWLHYWYNDDLEALRAAWGANVPAFTDFASAPVPPPNVGLNLPVDACTPGRLSELPPDPWEQSTWRYDWRVFLDDVGARSVSTIADGLRRGGARQMIAVGNNSWTLPNLAANQWARGYNPYFFLDEVDYLCQHNYPAMPCWGGGNGDPLDSEEAMQFWLCANQVTARIFGSLGKPVIAEEFGWYGGGPSWFHIDLPHRREEDQTRLLDRVMETAVGSYAGWLNWAWKDMPHERDITNHSGLFLADGKTVKHWGRRFGEWARQLKAQPPIYAPATHVRDLPMKTLYTSDRGHEGWWQETCRTWDVQAPDDFRHVFESKPMVNSPIFHQFVGVSA
jgi:hypothetical protein